MKMTTQLLNPLIYSNSALANAPLHYQLLMDSLHPTASDSSQEPLPAPLQNPTPPGGNNAALEWRLVACLEQETQLEQLARIYRCFVHSRTERHVSLHCAQLAGLRCQFKWEHWTNMCDLTTLKQTFLLACKLSLIRSGSAQPCADIAPLGTAGQSATATTKQKTKIIPDLALSRSCQIVNCNHHIFQIFCRSETRASCENSA